MARAKGNLLRDGTRPAQTSRGYRVRPSSSFSVCGLRCSRYEVGEALGRVVCRRTRICARDDQLWREQVRNLLHDAPGGFAQ
jgi:hypothetical protein